MKISEQELQEIIKQEVKTMILEKQIDEKLFDKLVNKIKGFTDKLKNQPDSQVRGTPLDRITKFRMPPKPEEKPESDMDIAGSTEFTPAEISSTSEFTPQYIQEPSDEIFSIPDQKKPNIKFLSPVDDEPSSKKIDLPYLAAVEDEPQQNLFTYASGVKKDEKLKQKWQKEYDDAKKLPFSKALDAIRDLSNNPNVHKDIRKQAKSYVDRILNNESKKHNSYNKLYENWKRFIKG